MVEENPEAPTPPPVEGAVPASAEPARPPAAEEDWSTRFKYLLADFENFRRRSGKERDAVRLSARAEAIRALLPVYEATQRARDAAQKLSTADPLRKGVELLAREWEAFLDADRVVPVATVGAPFRPELHEAVAEASPRPGVPAGSVAEVVQQGYRMDSTILRPAKVVVARAPVPHTPAPGAAAAAAPDESGEMR